MSKVKLVTIKFEKNDKTPKDFELPFEQMISIHLIKKVTKEIDKFILTIYEQGDDINMFIEDDVIKKLNYLTVFSELYEVDVAKLFESTK